MKIVTAKWTRLPSPCAFWLRQSSSGSKHDRRPNHSLQMAWWAGHHKREGAHLVSTMCQVPCKQYSLSLTAILPAKSHLRPILQRKKLRCKVNYQRWHDDMASKRWSQGLNSVVQAESLGVVLDSSLSHSTPSFFKKYCLFYLQNTSKIWLLTPFITTTPDLPPPSHTWMAPLVLTLALQWSPYDLILFYFSFPHLSFAILASLTFLKCARNVPIFRQLL